MEIKKIKEGMTGQQVADLLYENFLALIRKIEQFPEEFEDDISHLIDKYIATLRGDLYKFIQTIFEECFGDEKFFKEMQELIDIYFNSQDIVNKLYDVINNLIDIYLSTGDMFEYIETIVIREVERIFENADDYPELVAAFKKYIREVIMGEYRGKPNGIASLDGDGKVPLIQLPYSSDIQDGIITKEEHKLLNTTLPNRISSVEQDINVLNGNASVTGSVDQKVATAVTNLVNGAPTAYDTLKEIADWIATSEADAADLVAKLNRLENEHDTDIKALQQVDVTLQNKDTDLQNQINALKSKSDGIQAGAEANVQSDWNVTDTLSDAYIKNKPGNASQSVAGLMSAADKKKLDGIAAGANSYSLPTASATTLGGVKVGSGLTISNGVLSVSGDISGGGDGSTVSFSAVYTEGVKIGTITINGVSTDIYIPVWNGTLAEYNAIATKKEDFIYNIIDNGSSDSGSGDDGGKTVVETKDYEITFGTYNNNMQNAGESYIIAAGGETVTTDVNCYWTEVYSDGSTAGAQSSDVDVSISHGTATWDGQGRSGWTLEIEPNTTGAQRELILSGSFSDYEGNVLCSESRTLIQAG